MGSEMHNFLILQKFGMQRKREGGIDQWYQTLWLRILAPFGSIFRIKGSKKLQEEYLSSRMLQKGSEMAP